MVPSQAATEVRASYPRRSPRDLTTTRIDRSCGRLKVSAFAFLAVFGLIDGKLVKLGLSKEPPASLKAAASDAVSGADGHYA